MNSQGIAFGDHIRSEKIKRKRNKEQPAYHMRGLFFIFLLTTCSLLLVSKLFSLQLIHGNYYRRLADFNRLRTITIHAPRGVIFDRNNTPLVLNAPGFREIVGDKTKILSKDQALPLLATGAKNIEVDSLRQYPYKEVTSHVLGYTGQITKEQLQTPEFSAYLPYDFLGKSGIERSYESTLRGVDGKQLIEIDAMGKPTRILGQTDPVPGQNITLTLDLPLQQATYDAMKDVSKGAVVVSTPDGQILAMVSKPTFDPNLFTLDETYKTASDSSYKSISAMLTDSDKQPLLNRVIGGVYPPGSTFKIVTAASGLQNKIIDDSYTVEDTGVLTVGTFSYANWFYTEYGRKEAGQLDVKRALARSNDIFFYKLAEKVGVPKLADMSHKMGAGTITGIDLPGEVEGTVPTEQWKKDVIKEQWYLGDTFHYGIGQGFLLTTPLQVNTWTQVVADGGSLNEPYLLKSQSKKVRAKNILSSQTINLIREGMIEACNTGGVAWPLFDFSVKNPDLPIDGKDILEMKAASGSAGVKVGPDSRKVTIACKTGTAQHGGEDTLPHAWITLFAPAYHPQIVVTVLKEASGEGSNEAAPIAKKIIEAWFSKKN